MQPSQDAAAARTGRPPVAVTVHDWDVGGFFVVGWGRTGWETTDPARRVRLVKVAVAVVAVVACSVDIPVPLVTCLIALAWVMLVLSKMRLGLMPGWPGVRLQRTT